ncbi:MAG: hypothetical protein ACYCOR_21575 [Acidobacteriaceae bacterium]
MTLSAVALLAHSAYAAAQDRPDLSVSDHHIVYHDVKTDASGGIVPWYSDSPSVAYDHDIRLVWDFWKNIRNSPDGVPYYLLHQVWKEHEDDPRGLGGDQIDMALDSWNLLYGYLGDSSIQQNMIMIANYWLDHGMSKPDILWANLPYPYNTDTYSGQYDGDMRAGKGYLQPDKAGSFGTELITLYKITGNRRYLDAAVKIADTLAARVTPGDANHSPWPFRVNAVTGKVSEQIASNSPNGTMYTAAYTSNWTPTLTLFSDLESLHQGQVRKYQDAARLVNTWLKTYLLATGTNKWGPFFEDVSTYSDTEINADTMAAYLLNHPECDPQWQGHARAILDWVEHRLGNHNFEKLHVMPIDEQTAYLVPGNSHTSRHASVELLYCEKTGGCSDKEQAIRRLNWATYSVNDDGKNLYPYDDIWLTDGYGDYVRNYLRSMASAPELAPQDQNHLLRSTSVIQHIQYSPDRITYRKFDAQSVERLKLGAAIPKSVTGSTMNWDEKQRVLTIHATTNEVSILLEPAD